VSDLTSPHRIPPRLPYYWCHRCDVQGKGHKCWCCGRPAEQMAQTPGPKPREQREEMS
jgi:predicted RNA-binding protein with PUA domain